MIFIYILLGLIALVCLVLFCDVRLKLQYKKSFVATVYILGIPFDAFWLIPRLYGRKKKMSNVTKDFLKQATTKKRNPLHTVSDLYSFLCAIFRALREIAVGLKQHLKVRVKQLSVTVATTDAATTATRYGEINTLCASLFSAFEDTFKFSANYKKVDINADFEKEKSEVSFCIILSMSLINLLKIRFKAYLAYLRDILELTTELAMKSNTQTKKGTTK